jgi:hypothetical protein
MTVVTEEARGRASERAPSLAARVGARLGDVMPGPRPELAWVSAAFVLAVGVALGYAVFAASGEGDPRTVTAQVDTGRLPGGTARLTVPEDEGEGAVLHVEGLTRPAGRRVFMVWLKRGDSVSPAGSYFAVDEKGRGSAAIPDDLRGVDAVLVSRELEENLPTQPTEPPVISAEV